MGCIPREGIRAGGGIVVKLALFLSLVLSLKQGKNITIIKTSF
jgi:hypothetical protein